YSKSENDKSDDWQLHASGKIERVAEMASDRHESIQDIWARCKQEITSTEHYEEITARGFPFGSAMQGVSRIWRRDGEALIEVQATDEIVDEISSFHLHPAVLD